MRDHEEIYNKDIADGKYVSHHIEESTEPGAVMAHIQRTIGCSFNPGSGLWPVVKDWHNNPSHNELP